MRTHVPVNGAMSLEQCVSIDVMLRYASAQTSVGGWAKKNGLKQAILSVAGKATLADGNLGEAGDRLVRVPFFDRFVAGTDA